MDTDLQITRLLRAQLLQTLSETPRVQDRLRLLSSGYKVFSQGQEDGMIAEVFRRIGTETRRFVEIGVEDGLECNTAFLLLQGWSGAWLECQEAKAAKAREGFKDYPVEVIAAMVTAETADATVAGLAGEGIDLLCIDIDDNDYWMWKAITTVQPRVVVIEYNGTLPPFLRKTLPYDLERTWSGSNYGGASLGAMEALGRTKGYSLVGCSLTGVNAFFVRDDLTGNHFREPFTALNHYEPSRVELIGPVGLGPGIGPWVDV